MIKRKIVFVLGAGAHKPYGFPLGGELITKILQSLTQPANASPFCDHLFTYIQNPEIHNAVNEFVAALNLSGHTSIDSFLATNAERPGFTEIGKRAVAWQLLPLEFEYQWSRQYYRADDWMSFLFETMLHGCLKSVDAFLANNSIDFVTFNYDRTLEDFLCTRIANTYNLEPADAWKKAQKFKIVHVYGSLGEFDPLVLTSKRTRTARDVFGAGSVKSAAESIELMYEARKGHSGVSDAALLITDAPYVCFLGFGFDPDNIERLHLDTICTGKQGVFATRYRTALGDWNRIAQRMSPAGMNENTEHFKRAIEWDALAFLHETQALG